LTPPKFSFAYALFEDNVGACMILNPESRLMLIAPHPDDEALACSIILQRAARAGAAVRVVYATDGDDNPWPQRVLERKWRINAADRKRWGKLRRSEAVAALRALGIDARHAQFLGLPDQGLTNLLRTDCRSPVARFNQIIRDWLPTDLLVPSIADTHPDHSALAVILRLVLRETFEPGMSVWSYAVHGKSAGFLERAQALRQSEVETAKKLAAIRQHKTQIKLSRNRFLAYAARPERLLKLEENELSFADGAIRSAVRGRDLLSLEVRLSPKLVSTGEKALFLLGQDSAGRVHCLKTRLPASSCRIEVLDCSSGRRRLGGRYCGTAFAGEFAIPLDPYSADRPLFVKLERRSLFFDEAGWLEIPALIDSPQITARERHPFEGVSLAIR
jgi:LmbE family N-acetylglucosaminyl deacetylase